MTLKKIVPALAHSQLAQSLGLKLRTFRAYLNGARPTPPDVLARAVSLWGETDTNSVSVVTQVTQPDTEIVMVRLADDLPGELPDKVVIPTAEKGHEEFDIMSDGWARGFGEDSPYLRTYRTAHAIRRFAEKRAEDFRTKALTQEFWEKHSGTQESRLAFFKKLAGVK